MSGYEQIVGAELPQGAQLKAGLESIAKAQLAHQKTSREQAYIDAIAIIYADASIPDQRVSGATLCEITVSDTRLVFGHAGLQTTTRNARADLNFKRQALARVFADTLSAPKASGLALHGTE